MQPRDGLHARRPSTFANETVRPRRATLDAIRAALERGGVEFLYEDGAGVGVRTRRPAGDA